MKKYRLLFPVLIVASLLDLTFSQVMTVQVDSLGTAISPELIGIFFEDINYAADGGLYPERIQNRSFEYGRGDNRNWNSLTCWLLLQSGPDSASLTVETEHPLNANNPHYAVLTVTQPGSRNGLSNEGFDGIAVKARERFNISLFARVFSGNPQSITLRLENLAGDILAQTDLTGLNSTWTKHTAVIETAADEANARLAVLVSGSGVIGLDMISVFPQNTFKSRPNGLRPDLAQVIADLKPKFVRFPGGCLAHGDGLENMYRWKDTIGPIEQRKAQRNIWRYHQTLGLGYFEYFQFCEDIGAEPLPVVPAGVCCQNSGNYLNLVPRGQQGIPREQMDEYVQEVLDLIEWANGPVTSKWGAKRAEAGHPKSFNLKYLGLGNEDVITPVFKDRYKMINDAVKAKYPDIIVIGTTGPFTDGRDYEEGWQFARQEKLPMVDEHGYKSPGWFWANLERFDAYDRGGTAVYVGEYAAHEDNRANTLRSALAEAAYLTSLERNGDLVKLSSYAPLLSKQGRTQWRPDLIYFDNLSVTPSINYYVQQLFSVNSGDVYLPARIEMPATRSASPAAARSGVLLGTWDTQAQFDDVRIESNGRTVFTESFEQEISGWDVMSGRWLCSNGVYTQNSVDMPALTMLAFDDPASFYTVNLRAMKTGGAEGFLIGFGAIDKQNYYWLNLGGWGNNTHAIEKTTDGAKSTIGPSVEGEIESNRWYDIKIHVTGQRIQCYLDGQLLIDINDAGFVKTPDVAASAVRDSKTGDVILKLVSKSDSAIAARVDLSAFGTFKRPALQTVLTGSATAVNEFGQAPQVLPRTSEIELAQTFAYDVPPHSLTVFRIKDLK